MKAILLNLPIPEVYPDKQRIGRSFPLAAGYLKSAAMLHEDLRRWEFEIPDRFQNDLAGDAMLEDMLLEKRPDVVGLSLYCWNKKRSLHMASRLKEVLPGTVIVTGGPEVTENSPDIFRGDAVDAAVQGPGEWIFPDLLRRIEHGAPLRSTPGALWYDGGICGEAAREPIDPLPAIPSPFLNNCLDLSQYRYVFLETARGCPFRCKFCSEKGRNRSPGFTFPLQRIGEELEMLKAHGIAGIYFIDSAFNRSGDYASLCRKLSALNDDRRIDFFVSCLAELITPSGAALLDASFVVDVGLQSLNGEALRNVSRKLNLSRFMKGMGCLRDRDIRRKAHVILGLPGDNSGSLKRMADFLECERETIPELVVFILQLLRDSELFREREKYGIRAQQDPPYFILQSSSLHFAELRETISLFQQKFSDPLWHKTPPLWTRTCSGNYPRRTQEPPERDLPPFPITRILMNPAAFKNPESPGVLSEKISRRLAAAVTIWIEDTADPHLPLIQNILRTLSHDNPYTVWNLILEAKAPFSPALPAEAMAAIRYLPGFLDYASIFLQDDPGCEYVRTGARAWLLLPWKGNFPRQWLQEVGRTCPIFWKVSVAAGEVIAENPSRALQYHLQERGGDGVVLDFSSECRAGAIRDVLGRLRCFRGSMRPGVTDRVLQLELESGADFADLSILPPFEECICTLNPGGATWEVLSRKWVAKAYLAWMRCRSGDAHE